MVDVSIVTSQPAVQVSETVVQVSIVTTVLTIEIGNSGLPGAGGGGSGETYQKLTSSTSISASATHKVYTNEGASGLVIVDLPAAAEGLKFTFMNTNADGFRLDAAGSNIIRLGTAVSGAGGTMTSTKIGSSITIRGTDTAGWIAECSTGVWKEA